MHPNVQPTCDYVEYAKYKKFYDDASAFERSLYWDFAQYLLVCLLSGIVLCVSFTIYVRVRKINGTLPPKEKPPVLTQTKRRKVPINKVSRSPSVIAIYQKDSVCSTSSSDYSSLASNSSFDYSSHSDDSSGEARSHSRPPFLSTRRSFVKIVGTIKDLPQKVQDEVAVPAFAKKLSGNKMKRSSSTSQVPHVTASLAVPVQQSIRIEGPSTVASATNAVARSRDIKPRGILMDSRSDDIPTSVTPSAAPESVTGLAPNCTSARANPEPTQERPSVPSTPRRPTLTFAKSMLDIPTSKVSRSSALKLPPLSRMSSAKSCLGIHVENHDGEVEEAQ